MSRSFSQRVFAALLVVAVGAACKEASSKTQTVASGTGLQPVVNGEAALSPAAVGDSGRRATPADVEFMTGMVAHHAQAVIMAAWAPTHGARRDLQLLCERIVVGQGDEIALMRSWLHDRKQPVPSATDTRMHMKMGDMEHDMLMPGMLTDDEMKALDKARGSEFDRLFLEGMLRHHQGAIEMVNKLFATNAAAQEETVFKFANDVYADQTTEIAVMEKMLATIPASRK